jgi:hypothetical protein
MKGMQAAKIEAPVLARLEMGEADPAHLYRYIADSKFRLNATVPCDPPSRKFDGRYNRKVGMRGGLTTHRPTSRGATVDVGCRCVLVSSEWPLGSGCGAWKAQESLHGEPCSAR